MGPILAVTGGLLILILTKVTVDLATKEIQGRLDQLPFLILKLARRRLPVELREHLHDEWWLPDLCELRQRDLDRPITRLIKGLRFSSGLLVSAGRTARATASPSIQRWGFGAFLLVETALLLSAVFLAAILDPHPSSTVTVTDTLVGTIVPTILAATVAVLATVLRGNGPMLDLRLKVTWADLKVGLKLGVAGIGLTAVGALIWTRIAGVNNPNSAINTVLDGGKMPLTTAIVMFLYVWLVGPICEEIIFRGLLWGAIIRQQWGRWAAFGLSTAIFAASHLEPFRTTLLLVIGVPIGLARLRTDKLPASIVVHQMNNFLPALAMLLVSAGALT